MGIAALSGGFPNQCPNLEEIGFTIPGVMAEYIVVPAKLCRKVDATFERGIPTRPWRGP